MSYPETLAELRNFLYQRSERRWLASLLLAILLLVLTLVGVSSEYKLLISLAGLGAVVLPVAIAWLRESATSELLRGDKCRRLILYADGLGNDIPASQLAEVRTWSIGAQIGSAPFVPPYYLSELTSGPQRLADITTESAFYTMVLAGKLQVALWIFFGVAIVIAVSTLLLADISADFTVNGLLAAAKSIGVFVAFLVSGDLALLAKKYGDLRNEARLTFQQCSTLRGNTEISIEDVRSVTEEYGIALLQCPPIPSWLYKKYRNALNETYKETYG